MLKLLIIAQCAIMFFHSFINADCFTLGIGPRDAFLNFCSKYVSVAAFVHKHWGANTVALAC